MRGGRLKVGRRCDRKGNGRGGRVSRNFGIGFKEMIRSGRLVDVCLLLLCIVRVVLGFKNTHYRWVCR
jgi:hypothetical protein